MKKQTVGYWIVFAIFVAALICLFCGCDGLPDPPGGVARRHFCKVDVGSLWTPPDPGSPEHYASRPDYGSYGSPAFSFWASFSDGESTYQEGNVRADIFYCYTGGLNAKQLRKYTNQKGYALWSVPGLPQEKGSYEYGFTTTASGPRCSSTTSGVFGRVVPVWMETVDYYALDQSQGIMGEFWASGSMQGAGHLTPGQVGATDSGESRGLATKCDFNVILTPAEIAYLNSDPNTFGEKELVQFAPATWNISVLSDSGWTSRPTTMLHISFEGESPDNDLIRTNSTPYFAEWFFQTHNAEALTGLEFDSVVKLIGCHDPNSDPNSYATVKVKVVADSTNGRCHIARTQGIVFVDPNGFLPYHVTSDEGDDILVAPVAEGCSFRFSAPKKEQFVSTAAKYWLSDFKPLDVNDDGIVNLKDFIE